jgi:hypothetical protein
MADNNPTKKIQPATNCIRFWEAMLFYNRSFLPVETVVLIEATIKHLKGVLSNG